MAEPAIGFAGHARKIGISNAAADKRTDHVDCNLGVRLACKSCDRPVVEGWPGFGNVKTAVAGETREHRLDKIKRSGFAPG